MGVTYNIGRSTSGGSTTFLALTDTFASYTGNANKYLRVNAGENAIEATSSGASVAWGGITGTLADQTDLGTALSGKAATSHTHTLADITDAANKQNVLSEGAFVNGDKTKLDGIEALADVTDEANVLAALNTIASVAEGDILYRNASSWVRLPRGTDNQVLTATATSINWENAATGFADPMTTEGDIIYRSSGGTTRLPRGTNGQVLKSTGTTIEWGTDSGGSSAFTWGTATASTASANSVSFATNYAVEIAGDADVNLTIIDPSTIPTGVRCLAVFIPATSTRTVTNGLTSMDNFGGSIQGTTSERLVFEIFKDNTGNVNIAASVLS